MVAVVRRVVAIVAGMASLFAIAECVEFFALLGFYLGARWRAGARIAASVA